MKCLAYVSKVVARKNGAVVPVGLSTIFSVARKKNAKHNITGILSYRNGYYIQVLEGDSLVVDRLYSNILSDPRHHQVTTLFESPISHRFFPNWDMKLIESVNKDSRFLNFIKTNSQPISRLGSHKRHLLEIFCELNRAHSERTQNYEDRDLSLLAWPDFTSFQPSPTIMELCARLTKTSIPYKTLLEGKEFGTKQQLDMILNTFEARDILVIADSDAHPTAITNYSKSGRFYTKMKNFLRFN